MKPTHRRAAGVSTLALGLLVLAGPALAHPSFNPNQLPAGGAHQVDFVIPHGCVPGGGMPEEGQETSATIAVAVRLPDGIAAFTAADVEGWSVSSGDGVFNWTATDGGTTAPITLPVSISIRETVPEGETLHFSVAQDCAEGSVLWQAETGEDGDPAAIVMVGALGTAEHDTEDGEHAEGEHTMEDGTAMDGEHVVDDGDHATEDGEHATDEAASGSAYPGFGTTALVMLFVVVGGVVGILRMGGPEAE